MNDSSETIVLGDTYRDRLHGVKGIAVAHYLYLTGCAGVCLERLDKSGDLVQVTLDVIRVDWVSSPAAPLIKTRDLELTPGGPHKNPPSRHPG